MNGGDDYMADPGVRLADERKDRDGSTVHLMVSLMIYHDSRDGTWRYRRHFRMIPSILQDFGADEWRHDLGRHGPGLSDYLDK